MKPLNGILVGVALLALGGIGRGVGNFLYVITDTSFGPAGGSRLIPLYVPPLPPTFVKDTELCKGVTIGQWIGCTLSGPDVIATAEAKTNSGVASAANLTGADQKNPETTIEIGTDGESLAFDQTQFKVKANAIVLLKFKNNAIQSKMPHNLVIVTPGNEAKVANAGIAAGEKNNWVPQLPEVIAHTALVPGGVTTEVKFKAPSAGKYPFICTFPGHYLSMKGTMLVE